MNFKQFIQDVKELEQEVECLKKRAAIDAAAKVVETLLHLQGVVYPASNECLCNRNSASDEEVRTYYTSLFSAIRHLGFSDAELRSIVSMHEHVEVFSCREEVDPLDVESWVLYRGDICSCSVNSWAGLIARYLLSDK